MKVTKAIEILEGILNINLNYHSSDRKDALKLGIEALKRCQLTEPQASFKLGEPLPGETPE